VNLSGVTVVSVRVGAVNDGWSSGVYQTLFAYDTTSQSRQQGFFALWPSYGTVGLLGIRCHVFLNSAGTHQHSDIFTAPSLNAWHHYLAVFDSGNLQNTLYIDGALQSLSTRTHDASASSFNNNSLTAGSDTGWTSGPAACLVSRCGPVSRSARPTASALYAGGLAQSVRATGLSRTGGCLVCRRRSRRT